ncbi:MAG TPA: tyrosine-type recombinase/integrase [Dehalococcoidales bacterium]|nr:tyrosine-type recombinase/integrase [Dehalococcoidales bacterium]
MSELLHQIDTGAYMKPGKTTIADYLDRWLTDYVKPNLAPRTAEGYAQIIQSYLIPALGNIPLSQLRPEHLQKYYSMKLTTGRCHGPGGLSAQTVRHHHTALHKALQTAVEWGLVTRNPADAVKPPHTKRPEMQIWNEDEVIRFLEAAKATPYYALFYLLLFTGMRRSEVLALRWQDIDFIYSQIYVTRSLHHLKDGSYVFTQPKSERSRRTIALPPSAYLVLKEHWEAKEAEALLLGQTLADNDLVFCNLGKPLRPDTITRAWPILAARAGVVVIRLHDARHTHASIMLKQGIHPKIVQERLGHSSIQITLDTYSHVAPGLQEAAAQRFDDAFRVSHNETVKEKV